MWPVSGDTYTGNFQNGKKHGAGIFVRRADCVIMEGTWVKDKLHGVGQYAGSRLLHGLIQAGILGARAPWSGGQHRVGAPAAATGELIRAVLCCAVCAVLCCAVLCCTAALVCAGLCFAALWCDCRPHTEDGHRVRHAGQCSGGYGAPCGRVRCGQAWRQGQRLWIAHCTLY